MVKIESGRVYDIHTATGNLAFRITFSHCNNDKKFVDGITSEELIQVLIDRHTDLIQKKPTTENINVLTHLQQAEKFMYLRSRNKRKFIKKQNDNS